MGLRVQGAAVGHHPRHLTQPTKVSARPIPGHSPFCMRLRRPARPYDGLPTPGIWRATLARGDAWDEAQEEAEQSVACSHESCVGDG